MASTSITTSSTTGMDAGGDFSSMPGVVDNGYHPSRGKGRGGGGGGAVEQHMPIVNMGPVAHALLKLLFIFCVIMQVILSPSVMSITFACTLALHGIMRWLYMGRKEAILNLTDYGVFPIQGRYALNTRSYVFTCIIAIYMLVFFLLYSSHEIHNQPSMTNWIHPDYIHNYSFNEESNNNFEGLDVTSDDSKFMRSHTYTWPKSLVSDAIRINATLAAAGPMGASLFCNGKDTTSSSNFACYAAKLVDAFPTPDPILASHNFVPMPSQFYSTDVMVTPAVGSKCSDLEVYRIIYDYQRNVEYGLDYPAAVPLAQTNNNNNNNNNLLFVPPSGQGNNNNNVTCGLFSDPTWCLSFQHSFTAKEYTSRIASKCTDSKGSLIFRLPPRTVDVDPDTGRMGLDVLIVTAGASVSFKYEWHSSAESNKLLNTWDQWSTTTSDQVQSWRDSSLDGAIFCKFAVAITPLLLLWYYLAVNFEYIVSDNQVLFTCLFVLMPSVLMFITVGAWLPMSGAILCTIAINYSQEKKNIRGLLLFITGVCNSIQLVWMSVLVIQAGWNALLYDYSLKQLGDKTGSFVVSGTPSWVGLTMPLIFVVNFFFFVASIIGGVMEFMS